MKHYTSELHLKGTLSRLDQPHLVHYGPEIHRNWLERTKIFTSSFVARCEVYTHATQPQNPSAAESWFGVQHLPDTAAVIVGGDADCVCRLTLRGVQGDKGDKNRLVR